MERELFTRFDGELPIQVRETQSAFAFLVAWHPPPCKAWVGGSGKAARVLPSRQRAGGSFRLSSFSSEVVRSTAPQLNAPKRSEPLPLNGLRIAGDRVSCGACPARSPSMLGVRYISVEHTYAQQKISTVDAEALTKTT